MGAILSRVTAELQGSGWSTPTARHSAAAAQRLFQHTQLMTTQIADTIYFQLNTKKCFNTLFTIAIHWNAEYFWLFRIWLMYFPPLWQVYCLCDHNFCQKHSEAQNIYTFPSGSEGEGASPSEFGTCNLQLWHSWGTKQIKLIFGFLEMISLVKIRKKQIVEKMLSTLCFQNHSENILPFSWSGNCLTTNNYPRSMPGILILSFCQEYGVQAIRPNICNGSEQWLSWWGNEILNLMQNITLATVKC